MTFRALRALFAPTDTPIAPRADFIGGLIALVAAAMAFLAVAATEAGLAADHIAGRWSGELSASATVRITGEAANLPATIDGALGVLEVTPGVAVARVLSDDENRALLAPWLGEEADIAALPLPVLIDVTLSGAGPDVEELKRQLALSAPGAIYDDHGEWRAPLLAAADALRIAAGVGVALTIAALAAMVSVAAAATLWSGAGVVRTLHLIGAEDRFIVRAFERPFAIRAALGAFCGTLLAWLIAARIPQLHAVDVMAGSASQTAPSTWWLLPAVPLVAGATALLATRLAAAFVLKHSE
ncbi:MAG: cell division protein FtsX [Pseudomonadota bacterium]